MKKLTTIIIFFVFSILFLYSENQSFPFAKIFEKEYRTSLSVSNKGHHYDVIQANSYGLQLYKNQLASNLTELIVSFMLRLSIF